MGVARPAHHPPGVGIEHHAAVDFALSRGVLGYVSHPELIGSVTSEIALDQILKCSRVRKVVIVLAERQSGESLLDHELVHGLPGDGDAQPQPQFRPDSLVPVGAAGGAVTLGDDLPEPLAPQLGLGNGRSLPDEVSGGCDPQDSAALLGPVALPDQDRDHRVLPFGLTSPSAKRAEACLVISNSVSSSLIRFLA